MTISIVNGSILEAKERIKVQQVNCKGVMGSGIAKLFRNTYPGLYESYKQYCNSAEDDFDLLGCLHIYKHEEDIIANVFGQYDYGGFFRKQHTNYAALEEAFKELRTYCYQNSIFELAIPHGLGSGLGGGDSYMIHTIIDSVFKDYSVTLYKID